MKKIYFTLLILLLLKTVSQAQFVDNALLFSQQNYGSTARSKAMGNAFGALGGDFGSLSINPAGIGIYQANEISSTLSVLNQNSSESTYQGNSFKENSNKFNIKNLGYVFVIPAKKQFSRLISCNFGVGFNRLANFNQNSYVATENSPYSRMDAFVRNTNGIHYWSLMTSEMLNPYTGSTPWESILAWENYLIDVTNPEAEGDQYTNFLLENEKVKQREKANHEGYLNEYVAAFGLNINHRLYLGASMGVQNLRYNESKTYTEVGIDEVGTNLKSWGQFDYSATTKTSGYGINFKFGAIFRPIPTLKIGVALHTPTMFQLRKTFSYVMSSNLTGISDIVEGNRMIATPMGHDDFKFHSPFRATGSLGYQIAKKSIVSGDFEYVNYSYSNYSHGLDGKTYSIENDDIKNVYKAVWNIRMGGEYKVTNAISLRGGVEFLGNPYKSAAFGTDQPNRDYNFRTYNGGIGYRGDNFSLDLTYGMGDKTNFLYLYTIEGVEVDPVKYHTFTHEILFTFGMKL